MKKKTFTFLLFLFLSSCGYEAVYSVKNRINYSFIISELTLTGDRQTNLKIKQILKRYSNPDTKGGKSFSLKISSNSEKITTTKDAAGNATKFKNEITVKVRVFQNGQYVSNFKVIENFDYNNNSNTLELRTYESEIKNNLAGAIVDKITSMLAKLI